MIHPVLNEILLRVTGLSSYATQNSLISYCLQKTCKLFISQNKSPAGGITVHTFQLADIELCMWGVGSSSSRAFPEALTGSHDENLFAFIFVT